ncbi:MAG: hypothetical protein KIS78_07930 [Labilithrix sp.]|nr:hypothetical protein [Labilithrix sp.]
MNHRALARSPDTEKNMFRAKIRGSLLDALERMSAQAQRDPNELLDELLTTATDATPPPGVETQATPPPTPGPKATAPASSQAARMVHHNGTTMRINPPLPPPHPSVPRVGESIASKRRREEGENASASDEDTSGTAPPEQMRGSRPNPLSNIKRWASGAGEGDGAEKPGSLDQEPDEDDERERRRKKYLNPSGSTQNRG